MSRIVCISDVHVGTPLFDNQDLTDFRRFVDSVLLAVGNRRVTSFVINGDGFDTWDIRTDTIPKSVEEILEEDSPRQRLITGFSAQVRRVHDSGINVYYIRGNHDMFISETVIRRLFGRNTTVCDALQLSTIHFEHGHRFDLFNLPTNTGYQINGRHMPVGYFITRVARNSNRSYWSYVRWKNLEAALAFIGDVNPFVWDDHANWEALMLAVCSLLMWAYHHRADTYRISEAGYEQQYQITASYLLFHRYFRQFTFWQKFGLTQAGSPIGGGIDIMFNPNEVRSIFRKPSGCNVVCVGHSHSETQNFFSSYENFQEVFWQYVNIGSWGETEGRVHSGQRYHTYIEFDIDRNHRCIGSQIRAFRRGSNTPMDHWAFNRNNLINRTTLGGHHENQRTVVYEFDWVGIQGNFNRGEGIVELVVKGRNDNPIYRFRPRERPVRIYCLICNNINCPTCHQTVCRNCHSHHHCRRRRRRKCTCGCRRHAHRRTGR